MDSQTQAQNLAVSISAATAPPQIAAVIWAVSEFLRRHPSDQSRPFFSLAFPSLLQRIFGFDSISWLGLATSDPNLSSLLLTFLSPQGPLVSSIFSVDQQDLVKYIFPVERLPEWIRLVLQNPVSSQVFASASPFLASRIKEDEIQNLNQIQLNVFEYYIFWFAYYPISRGSASNLSDPNSFPNRPTRKSKIENWVSSLPVISTTGRKIGQKPECSLYLKLLYSYLKAFVPKTGFIPYKSSMLNYSLNGDETSYFQAEFIMNTFIQFWLIDNDFSPLPVQIYQSFGVNFRDFIGKNPPTPGLGDMVKLLINYLNFKPEEKSAHKVFDEMIQRPLYRFILRSFLYCPIGAPTKNISQIFSLWVSYLEPWKLSEHDFIEFEINNKGKGIDGNNINNNNKEYLINWQDYVLSNYLFYSSMVVHFLDFAHRFIQYDVVSVIQMVSKILDVICSSKEFVNLIQQVDKIYHIKRTGSNSSYSLDNKLYKYAPLIHDQLKDWEDGLSESVTNLPYLHEKKDSDLRLFSDSEDGAKNLLQFLVTCAEYEIQFLPSDVSKFLQTLDSIKSRIKQLYGDQIIKTPTKTNTSSPPKEAQKSPSNQINLFTPRRPKKGINYKGDWMHRPISTDEVAFLARVLIRVSEFLNKCLDLDQNAEVAGPTYVEVKGEGVRQITGFKEAIWVLFMLVFSWFVVICNLVLGFMRRRGMRVNLRVLASKKLMGVVLLYLFWVVIQKVFLKGLALLGF